MPRTLRGMARMDSCKPMSYFRSQRQQQLAYIPCAPGCMGSSHDPRGCVCVCGGINHGCLVYGRPVQPIPVPYGQSPASMMIENQIPEEIPLLPDLRPFEERHKILTAIGRGEIRLGKATGHASAKMGKKIGKSFLKAISGGRLSEQELNESILHGLRKQFSEERVNAIVDEGFTEFLSHNPDLNRPELYELYETGILDNVLERRGIRWVLGRPKYKTGR